MVDWGLARQIARLAAGRGSEDAAAVRRRRAVGRDGAVGCGLHRPCALDAHTAGRGREPSRVGVSEPRLAVADPRPGGRAARRAPRVRRAAGRRASSRSVGHGGRRGRPRDGLPVLAGARPVRRLASGRRRRSRACCSWGRTWPARCATSTWTPTRSAAGSARTSSRTCSSSRACPGCASTWRPAAPLRRDARGADRERLGGRVAVAARIRRGSSSAFREGGLAALVQIPNSGH